MSQMWVRFWIGPCFHCRECSMPCMPCYVNSRSVLIHYMRRCVHYRNSNRVAKCLTVDFFLQRSGTVLATPNVVQKSNFCKRVVLYFVPTAQRRILLTNGLRWKVTFRLNDGSRLGHCTSSRLAWFSRTCYVPLHNSNLLAFLVDNTTSFHFS